MSPSPFYVMSVNPLLFSETNSITANTDSDLMSEATLTEDTPLELPVNLLKGMQPILSQLRIITGHDFSLYKKSTISRRIARRMTQHTIGRRGERRITQQAVSELEIYARYLKEHPAEAHALFRELLINVTYFFRDAEAFQALETSILPKLCANKPDDYVLRVWVAGCASGEEAYSIAILLYELQAHWPTLKVQIYSTDLDDDAIAVARAGLYPLSIAEDVTPERLQRFFIQEPGGYRIKKEIRDLVVFAVQSVIKDPPFTKLDLLCCRNLLIYLEPELQNRLIPTLHYALKPGGVLFLSPSESIGNHTELFAPLSRKWKIYRAQHLGKLSHTRLTQHFTWLQATKTPTPSEAVMSAVLPNTTEFAPQLLAQCFAPASVLSDLQGNILYVHGETGQYLRPAPGKASLNIIDMAREGLDLALRTALQAANQGLSTAEQPISVKHHNEVHNAHLSVRPVSTPDMQQTLLLISFLPVIAEGGETQRKHLAKLKRIEALERDLAHLKESYQAALEEQRASNEELKSANEELQSTNEELQSSNEDLETSKEELQAVNVELQNKIAQLANMQNDMKNLLDNIVIIGMIFLDRHLVIRSFTRDAIRIYRLVSSDVGRPLTDIKPIIEGDDLLIAAKDVLNSLIPYEREMRLNDDTWVLARIQPYRTLENVIDGVVLTFTDISAKMAIFPEPLKLADSLVQTVREPLLVLDSSLHILAASQAFYQTFALTADNTLGRVIYSLQQGQWALPQIQQLLETLLLGKPSVQDYVIEYLLQDVGLVKLLLNVSRVVGKSGETQLLLVAIQVML